VEDIMNSIEQLALSKALSSAAVKEAREQVAPGRFSVDFLVRILGELTVGEDHEAIRTGSLPWLALATVALSKLNDATVDKLIAAFEDGTIGDLSEAEGKPMVRDRLDAVKLTTKAVVKGRVSAKLVALTVEGEGEAAKTA
jgi:hypothetical protein